MTSTPVEVQISADDVQNGRVYDPVRAACPPGTRLVGGGYSLNPSTPKGVTASRVVESGPLDEETWQLVVQASAPLGSSGDPSTITLTAKAICAG